jgi:SpoIID/LytB domain protein
MSWGRITPFVFILSALAGVILLTAYLSTPVYAQSCDSSCKSADECRDKIAKCQEAWNQMEAAKKPHVDALKKMEADIAAFQSRIKTIESDVVKKAAAIAVGEKDLEGYVDIAGKRIRQFYMRQVGANSLTSLFSSTNVGFTLRVLAYQRAVTNEDKKVITQTALSVRDLEDRKKALESERSSLAYIKAETDKRAASVRTLVGEAESYQTQLSGIIASLTAQQQAILTAKAGTFQTSVGDVPLSDDPASRPDYNPGFSPAFAAFSFGAPHFKGMSQYGAYGRAKSGQSYQDILKAYYGGGIEIRDHDKNAQISVQGYATYSLEEYTKRIYEMPGSWGDDGGMEALKAQAVAARSYALARGGTICATEACQVFKPEPKGGNWDKAVNDTAGKVVYANGQPFSTWYSSTSGGYQESYSGNGHTTPGFWDTKNGRSGWTGEAYEKIAGSPWFYKAWYRERSGDSCGRSHPWLSSEEMADILNAWKVLFEGGGESGRVTPLGSCWGGNPYTMAELRAVGGFTGVSGVSVTYSENGVTATVTFQTNKGSVSINGTDFKKAFNLRAPARVALKSGLFNIEKK